MARKSPGVGYLILILILGGIIGSVLGEILGLLIPSGVASHRILSEGVTVGMDSPLSLDLGIIFLSFALRLKINLMGVMGIVGAVIIYRKFA